MTDESAAAEGLKPDYDWDFFLAHAGDDLEIAENLKRALDPPSKAFLDFTNIQLGDDWDARLSEAQRSSLISENNPAQGNLIKETIENSIGQDTNIAEIPPRIYIQIAREDQREAAGEMARQLQARGFVVPGIENIQGKASVPSVTQLRYYQTGASQDDVNKISEYIRSIDIKLEVPGPLRSGKARPRDYELWFSNDFPPRRTPVRTETPIKLPERVETPIKTPDKVPDKLPDKAPGKLP